MSLQSDAATCVAASGGGVGKTSSTSVGQAVRGGYYGRGDERFEHAPGDGLVWFGVGRGPALGPWLDARVFSNGSVVRRGCADRESEKRQEILGPG